MDTVGRVTKVQGSDWIIERHLLGLGVLLVTVSAGYFLSGLSGGRDVRPIAQEARAETAQVEKTAATLGVDDPFDPKANIEAGVKHLRAMMDRFDNNIPLALAAYNAGEVAVIKHRGIPPYRETRAYVKRILKRLDRSTAAA